MSKSGDAKESEILRFLVEFKDWLFEVEESRKKIDDHLKEEVVSLRNDGNGTKGTAVLEDGEFAYLDEKFSRFFGYRESESLIGERWEPVICKKGISPNNLKEKLEEKGEWTDELTLPGNENGVKGKVSLKKTKNNSIVCRVSPAKPVKEEEKSTKKLTDLRQGLERLHEVESEGEICRRAIGVTEDVFNFDFSIIRLRESGFVAVRENSPEDSDGIENVSLPGDGFSEKVFREGKSVRINDLTNHPNCEETCEDFHSYLGVPIGQLGTVQLISSSKNSFSEEDLDVLKILANNLEERIKRTKLEEELTDQAVRDQLTGLFNRHYLGQVINKEIERAQRYGHRLAFLMIDINNFKDINDYYSHNTGDEVLVEVGNLLQENVREADTVIRYGGDEFLILLPETGKGVSEVIPRLKESIRRWSERTEIIELPLSLAIGSSYFTPEEDMDAQQAIARADEDMFEDKKGEKD